MRHCKLVTYPARGRFRGLDYKRKGFAPYLITIQLHHRVHNLNLAFGSHGAGLSKVQRSRSGPAGRRRDSVGARKGGRRKRSLGSREGSKGRREKTRRRRERGNRRGRKGPARESGTRPKSVHGVGIRQELGPMLGKASARLSLFLFGSETVSGGSFAGSPCRTTEGTIFGRREKRQWGRSCPMPARNVTS